MINQYYPGRGVFFDGSDRATRTNSAVLHLTMTGKESTADLPAVNDGHADEEWHAGVAPCSAVVGIHYADGQLITESFPFAVEVLIHSGAGDFEGNGRF